MGSMFGATISAAASINSEDKQRTEYEKYIRQRAKECLVADKIELSKRAIDAGAKARTAIAKMVDALEIELNKYLSENMDVIVKNNYELLHISELEARSELPGYRTGKIIAEIQRIVVFKRG